MAASHHYRSIPSAAALTALLAGFWALGAPAVAQAAEPGSLSLGLSPVYAYFVVDSENEPAGGGVGMTLSYALSHSVSFDVFGQWTGHSISATEEDTGGLYQIYHAALGLSYAFDVINISPVIEGGFGVLHHRYQERTVTNLAFRFGIAVDYWLWQWLGLGAAIHYHANLSNPADYPVYFDIGPRFSLRWVP